MDKTDNPNPRQSHLFLVRLWLEESTGDAEGESGGQGEWFSKVQHVATGRV
jgi:hypothetical protein